MCENYHKDLFFMLSLKIFMNSSNGSLPNFASENSFVAALVYISLTNNCFPMIPFWKLQSILFLG